MLPGGGDDGGKETGSAAIGNGRRMPIQQAVDVAVPISTAYNQWTQFEEWPNFMHRLDRVSQEDETHVAFKTKIWGISKEFTAEIVDQRPGERIKWTLTDGVSHTGVVTFHELAERLTRVDVDVYVEPGSLIEKAGRGMRHVKRAIRADLARFKAYIELEEEETGEWRGTVDDGDVKSTTRSAASGRSSRTPSGGRTRAASSGSRSKSRASGSRRKSASSGSRRKSASSGSRSKSASSGGRCGAGSNSGSSNGRSGSSGSGARAASNGRTGSRSGRKQTTGSRS
jgi:uncharacterized membrane protein